MWVLLLAVLPTVMGSKGLRPPTVIPLFPPGTPGAQGRELEPVDTAKTIYEGAQICYVSEHGQRSSACSRFDKPAIEVFDNDKAAAHHPLHV